MHPAERRELIRREGTRLFGKDGYAATRLEDVAAGAGVTKPMVYRHFASKRELYLAILRRHEAHLPTFTERLEPRSEDSDGLVATILNGWLDYVVENSDAWLVIFRDSTGDPAIERARRRVTSERRRSWQSSCARVHPTLSPS